MGRQQIISEPFLNSSFQTCITFAGVPSSLCLCCCSFLKTNFEWLVLASQESPEEMIERMRASLEDYKVKNLLSSHIHLLQAANEEAVAKTAEVFKEGKTNFTKRSPSYIYFSPNRLNIFGVKTLHIFAQFINVRILLTRNGGPEERAGGSWEVNFLLIFQKCWSLRKKLPLFISNYKKKLTQAIPRIS